MPQDSKAGRTHSNISSKPTPQGVNWLLVIAIDEYQHCAKLRNCVSDAKKIIKVLQEKYQFEQVIELYNEVATKTNIVAKLNELGERINKDVDNLILYFSGHGETEGEEDEDEQIGYLIPVEAASGDESQYIPHLFLRSKLNRIRTKHTFVVIDACFAGSFFYNVRSEKRTGSENLPSRWGISSSSSHEVALDGAPGDNSPFANCLLAALENNDTPLGIHGLAAAVENRMQAQRAKQTPICLPFSDPNRYSGQFYFHPKQNEANAWAQAQQGNSIAAYEAFLNYFPNGFYAPDARKRLSSLKDDAFWEAVVRTNTEAAYLDYYERGLDFERKQAAYRKMQQLDEEKSWRIAALRDSIPAYLEYLEKHPNGANASEARKRINALRPKEIPKVEPTPPIDIIKIEKEKPQGKQLQYEFDKKAFFWYLASIGGTFLLVIVLWIWQLWDNKSNLKKIENSSNRIEDAVVKLQNPLQLIEGDSIILNDYYQFVFNKYSVEPRLNKNNYLFLDAVASYLKIFPKKNLTITGWYRSGINSLPPVNSYYENIGVARANAIRNLLIKRGIIEERISLDYYHSQDSLLEEPLTFNVFMSDTVSGPFEKQQFSFTNMTFSDANFAFNSADFNPGEPFKLYADSVRTYLEVNPAKNLTIIGHTDNVGSNNYNANLGLRRAQSARAYFQKKGVKSEIKVASQGEKRPTATNETEEGRQKNRRVNFVIN